LFHPRGLAIDSSNNLYVVDTGFDRVLEFTPTGEQLAEYGPRTGVSLRQPTDVVVDQDGHLFVADTGSMRLIVLDRSGRLLHEWPLPRADTRRGVHLALAPDGSLWLTDPQDSSLLHQDSSGRSLAKLGPQGRSGQFLWQPVGIHVDRQGNLYIADAQAGQVVRIAAGQIP
jgi:sugar lactone lactonase YvrE